MPEKDNHEHYEEINMLDALIYKDVYLQNDEFADISDEEADMTDEEIFEAIEKQTQEIAEMTEKDVNDGEGE